MDAAITGSTHAGEAWVQPKVASISVMEWPRVKAVMVRSNASHTWRRVGTPGMATNDL